MARPWGRPPRGRHGRLLDTTLIVRSYVFLGLVEAVWAMFMFFLVLHVGGWRYGQVLADTEPLVPKRDGCHARLGIFAQVGNRFSGGDTRFVRS